MERERSKEIELIADTGAIYTAIPGDILRDLGIVVREKRRFKTVSGELKELPVGEAYIEIAGEEVTSIVAFPITEELRPMEFFSSWLRNIGNERTIQNSNREVD